MALQQIFMVNMKKHRKQAGLTQEKLAEFCNTDPCYIRQIESGRRFPSITYIERIAAALSIAPYLLFYDELPKTEKGPSAGLQNPHCSVCLEQKERIKALLIENISQDICSVIDKSLKQGFPVSCCPHSS